MCSMSATTDRDERPLKLIVGLGNPGPEYAETRHNIGFRVLERFAESHRIAVDRKRFRGRFGQGRLGAEDVALLEPMTYMNASGEAVEDATRELRIDMRDVIVAYDEVDFELGIVRVRSGGGDAGHRGIRSIMEETGTGEFLRVRVGIGRPAPSGDVKDWVLSEFEPEQTAVRDQVVEKAAEAVELVIRRGLSAAMNRYNQR